MLLTDKGNCKKNILQPDNVLLVRMKTRYKSTSFDTDLVSCETSS